LFTIVDCYIQYADLLSIWNSTLATLPRDKNVIIQAGYNSTDSATCTNGGNNLNLTQQMIALLAEFTAM
jgi:hypothetical protein